MGYNGNNRRGYDVRYQGFKKSSERPGNRLFGAVGNLGILAGIKLLSNTPSANETLLALGTADFSHSWTGGSNSLSKNWLPIVIGALLACVPLLHWLSYITFSHGWWPFFSFLFFGSPAVLFLGFAESLLDTNTNVTLKGFLILHWCILAMMLANIAFGLWLFWLVPFEEFVLAHWLVILQDMLTIIFLIYLHSSYKRVMELAIKKEKGESE